MTPSRADRAGAGDTARGDGSNYDVVIVGAGAAGLSAALVLTRVRRRVALIDGGPPRNASAFHVHGFLGADGMAPEKVLAKGRASVREYGGTIIDDTACAVSPVPDGYEIRLRSGRTMAARRVLMATGVVDTLPEIEGLRPRWGRDVLHCPYCHGYEVRDEPITVLAKDTGSIDKALLLAQLSADITVLMDRGGIDGADLRPLAARGIHVRYGEARRLAIADDRIQGLELDDGTFLPCSAVFLSPRIRPKHGLLTDLRAPIMSSPLGGDFVRVDKDGRTGLPGIWATGTLVSPTAILAHTASMGAVAGTSINADLLSEEVESALASQMP